MTITPTLSTTNPASLTFTISYSGDLSTNDDGILAVVPPIDVEIPAVSRGMVTTVLSGEDGNGNSIPTPPILGDDTANNSTTLLDSGRYTFAVSTGGGSGTVVVHVPPS